jgi:hypothetical protein
MEAKAKIGQGGGRVSLRGRTPLVETISSGRWRGRTPPRDIASWLGIEALSVSLGVGTMKARRHILAVGGFIRRCCLPPEMSRGDSAKLGKVVLTPWRAISSCSWSIFDTSATSDGDGGDWRRQWSPDGNGGGGDACPDGGGGGGGDVVVR